MGKKPYELIKRSFNEIEFINDNDIVENDKKRNKNNKEDNTKNNFYSEDNTKNNFYSEDTIKNSNVLVGFIGKNNKNRLTRA